MQIDDVYRLLTSKSREQGQAKLSLPSNKPFVDETHSLTLFDMMSSCFIFPRCVAIELPGFSGCVRKDVLLCLT